MTQPPDGGDIADYALLGDTRSAALVSSDGSIDWCCFPRFDSPACFAAILGDGDNGRWALRPVDRFETRRRYLPGTMLLETTFTTEGGAVTVLDGLIPDGPAPIGTPHRLVRLVTGVTGTVTVETRLVIRFDYGSIVPWVRRLDDGRIVAVAGPEALILATPVELAGEGWATAGRFEVAEGDTVGFDLSWYPSMEAPPGPVDVAQCLADATSWWRDWSSRLVYDGAYEEQVHRSLIVLKALTHSPTGSVVAAPTTSLPEWPGGTRNWDYRYCWLRDATFTLLALLQGGCTAEASAWRDWLVRAVAGDPGDVQIMYGLGGERRLPELELGWLPGFGGATPVRVGNAAAEQRQLDVYGEVIEAFFHASRHGLDGDPVVVAVQGAMLDWLADNWHLPDNGIWESRGEPAQYTFSKVMAWVAFDRGVRLAEEAPDVDHHGAERVGRWRAERDRIHAQVCQHAVDDRGVFTQAYGRIALDSACLMIPIVGFLPIDDPRVAATITAIEAELTVDGYVRRYLTDEPGQDATDGVGGDEGTFLLCSFWLVECLAMQGRTDEATALFERLLAAANDVGLLAEQLDPGSGRLLGNFPQAFSHVAVVSAAMLLCPSHVGPTEMRSGLGRRGGASAL